MTIYALPAIPGVASVDWDLDRNVLPLENPLGRTVRRLIRQGDRWTCGLRFPLYNDDDAGVLTAWLAQISQGDAHFYVSPPQNAVRGAWNPANRVSNGDFLTGATTGWTLTDSAVLSVNARRLKITNGAASPSTALQDFTAEANKPHVVLVDVHLGKTSQARCIVQRNSDSVLEADSGNVTAPTRMVLLVTPTITNMRVRLYSTGSAIGDNVLYSGISITRCLQVNGASQTGTRLNVDGGPASTNAALKAGEFVCFLNGTLYQLVRLTEDFDTDSAGAGTLAFQPALRGSPADNAAVIVRNPFTRMMVSEHFARESVSAPNFRGLAIDGIEDVTP